MKKLLIYTAKLISLTLISAVLSYPLHMAYVFLAFVLGFLGYIILALIVLPIIYAYINIAFWVDSFGREADSDKAKKPLWKKLIRTAHLTIPGAILGWLFVLM